MLFANGPKQTVAVMTRWILRWTMWLFMVAFASSQAYAQTVTLQVRNAERAEVIEMIAKQHEVNILMSGEVGGEVSLSLYDSPYPVL